MPRDYILQLARLPEASYKVLFHLWATANWKDGVWSHRWGTEIVKRGERICSQEGLAFELGMSRQKVRTALKALERLGEIQPTENPHFTRVKLLNYDAICTSGNYYTSESQPTANPQLTTIEEGKTLRSKEIRNTKNAASRQIQADVPYKRPDPKTDPLKTLVFAYKLQKGFEADDRGWDKRHFSRCSKPASELLQMFKGDLAMAVNCLEAIAKGFDAKGLEWTLETVAKHADEWKLKRRDHGHNDSSRVFSSFVKQRPDGETPRSGGLISAGSILHGVGNMPDVQVETIANRREPGIVDEGLLPELGEDSLEEKPD